MRGLASMMAIVGLTVLTFLWFMETVPFTQIEKSYYTYNIHNFNGIANFSIIPNETNRWDLGNWTNRWRYLFTETGIYLKGLLLQNVDGNLVWDGETLVNATGLELSQEAQNNSLKGWVDANYIDPTELQSSQDSQTQSIENWATNQFVDVSGDTMTGDLHLQSNLFFDSASRDIKSDYSLSFYAKTFHVHALDTASEGAIYVTTTKSDGTSTNRLIITGGSDTADIHVMNSKVGIGTNGVDSPEAKLDIRGGELKVRNSEKPVTVGVNDGENLGYVWMYDSGYGLKFGTSGTERMRITSDGKIGIGVTNPIAKFQIGTNTESQQWSGSNPYVLIQGVDNEVATPALTIKDENLGKMFEVTTTGDGSVGRVYVGGKLGVGTESPGEKLDVSGNIKLSGEIKHAGNPATFLRSTSSNANSWIFHEAASSWGVFHYNTDDGSICQNSILLTRTDGNVGWDSGTCGDIPSSTEATIILNNQHGNIWYRGTLYVKDGNTKIYKGNGNSVRIQTNYGYIEVGPQNTYYAHFVTDRDRFYFNKPVYVNGNLYAYGGTKNLQGWTFNGYTTDRLNNRWLQLIDKYTYTKSTSYVDVGGTVWSLPEDVAGYKADFSLYSYMSSSATWGYVRLCWLNSNGGVISCTNPAVNEGKTSWTYLKVTGQTVPSGAVGVKVQAHTDNGSIYIYIRGMTLRIYKS